MLPVRAKRCWVAGVVLAAAGTVAAETGATIKKCQDAEGRWHYGDTAAEECARSGIVELDTRGYKVKEQAPPRSAEEIEAERRARERAAAEEAARRRQALEDARLLETYESEADILRARDERLAYLAAQQKVNGELLKNLRARLVAQQQAGAKDGDQNVAALKAQIAEYEAHHRKLDEERQAVIGRYEAELARYRSARERYGSAAAARVAAGLEVEAEGPGQDVSR